MKELFADRFQDVRLKGVRPKKNEIVIDRKWTIVCCASPPKVIKNAARDLRRFFKEALKINLSSDKRSSKSIRVSASDGGVPESSSIICKENLIDITGNDPRGAAQGVYYLERMLSLRGGPFVRQGKMKVEPAFRRRINRAFFGRIWEHGDDNESYPDCYLQKLARGGFNAIHFYCNLYDLALSKTLPHLAGKNARKRLHDFRKLSERLAVYGLDIILHINNPPLPEDFKLFRKMPRTVGASTFEKGRVIPCSSHPKVLRFYAEAVSNLFRHIPKLAGVTLITGGECFLSCYSRPEPRTEKGTNCPRCARRSAEDVFAGMVNTITKAVLKVKKNAEVIVWPYSAFRWSRDKYQLEYIRKLDRNVILQSNFETNDFIVHDGVKSLTFDYNIVNIGPTKRFHAQTLLCRKRGIRRFAKTESNVSLDLHNVPYNPVMERWAKRFEAMRKEGLDGYQAQWRFTGYAGSLPEQLLEIFSFTPAPGVDEALNALASKAFGADGARSAVSAWKAFSEAWENFPFSGFIAGGKHIYMHGPLYIGPAHPLIFDVQRDYNLSHLFYQQRPYIAEGTSAEHESVIIKREPVYVSDLSWTQPWGVEIFLRHMQKVRSGWARGLALYEKALKKSGRSRRKQALKEFAVAKMVGCTLTTAINTAEFYITRDVLYGTAYRTSAALRKDLALLRRVAENELKNAEEALRAMDMNYALGYFDTYGTVYTREMIEAKIRQVKYVINHELPEYLKLYLPHIFEENCDGK